MVEYLRGGPAHAASMIPGHSHPLYYVPLPQLMHRLQSGPVEISSEAIRTMCAVYRRNGFGKYSYIGKEMK